MQQRGEFPIEKLCTFYPYTEMDKALADMHNGSVSSYSAWNIEEPEALIIGRRSSPSYNGSGIGFIPAACERHVGDGHVN